MKEEEKLMLNKIYAEQKVTNRNLQRISNVLLMMLFAGLGRDAKVRGDEQGKKLCKAGLCLTAVSQGLLIISDIVDIVKNGKPVEESDENEE